MKRSIAYATLVTLFLVQPALAETDVWEPATLKSVGQALETNPAVRAAERRWWQARSRVPQEAALPDPKVMLGTMTMRGQPGWEASVSQMIPFPGKLGLAEESAGFMAQALGFRFLEERQRVASGLKQALVELFALEGRLAIVEKNKAVLAQLSRQAIANYAVGKGLQQDVLRAQTEQSRLLDQRLELEHAQWVESAKLRALIGEAGDLPQAPAAFPNPALPGGWEKWEMAAVAQRPLLLAEESEIEAERRAVKLAERGLFPDLDVSFRAADQGSMGGTILGGNVGVNVPIWRGQKQDRAVDEAGYRLEAALARLEAMRLETLQMARTASAHLHHAVERIALLDTTLLPQARQTLAAGMTAYQVGKIEFVTLLGHQMALFELERERVDTVADFYKMLAELEALRGLAAPEETQP